MKVSIVCAAYNEEECLPLLVPKLEDVLSSLEHEYEIIVVNDASTDGTAQVLRDLAGRCPALRALEFEHNQGQTAAWAAGFRHAAGDVVVTIDADLQNDPEDIPALLEQIGEYDCVSGVRQGRQDSFKRKVSSKIANGVRNWFLGDRVTDVGCSLRAVRREFLDGMPMVKNMHRFMPTLLKAQGARCTEVPVGHHPRAKGTSKYGTWDRLAAGIVDLFGIRWMLKRWIRCRIKWDSAQDASQGEGE